MGPLYAVPSASGTAELSSKAPHSPPPPPRTPKPNPARTRSPAACSLRSCVPTLPRAPPAPRQGGLPRQPRCPPAPSCPAPLSPRPAAGAAPAATSSCPYSGAGQGGGTIPRRPPSCRGGTRSLTGTGGERGGGAGGEKPPARAPSQPSPPPPAPRPALTGRAGGAGGGDPPGSTPLRGTESAGRAGPGAAHSERRAGRREFGGGAERSSDEPASCPCAARLLALRGYPEFGSARRDAAVGKETVTRSFFRTREMGSSSTLHGKPPSSLLLRVVPRYLNLMRYGRCQRPVAPKETTLGSARAVLCGGAHTCNCTFALFTPTGSLFAS